MGPLEELIKWFGEIDKELHFMGKDNNLSSEKQYDVDYVNPRRILTGRESADIYEALEKYEQLVLYAKPLEISPFEMVSFHDGKRGIPAGEYFVVGYELLLEGNIHLITISETQLPRILSTDYRKLFEVHNLSRTNKERAIKFGMDRISVYAEGNI